MQVKDFQSLKQRIYEGLTWSEEEEKAALQFDRITDQDIANLPTDFHRNAIAYYQASTLTQTYKTLFAMPKGVLHHLHFDCSESRAFLLEISKHPHVYIDPAKKAWRVANEQNAKAKGFKKAAQLRAEFKSEEEWESHLFGMTQLSLHEIKAGSQNLWPLFEEKITGLSDICLSKELGLDYMRDSFGHYQREKYLRVEVRSLVIPTVDKDGKSFSEIQFLEQFTQVEKELQQKSPFSIGVIAQGLKMWPGADILAYWQKAASLKHRLLVGIDAVQQEQRYNQISAEVQFYTKGKETGLPFVLHAGETLNSGNINIHFALQLGTKRIGHGLNLFQHSYLFEQFKRQDVCIEVNPLSNLVMKYVADLRLHPAVTYHNYGLPISISPDDPSRFGVHGATFDWFVTVASFRFGLKDLKKVARGSIRYALCGEDQKAEMLAQFDVQWSEFIAGLLKK